MSKKTKQKLSVDVATLITRCLLQDDQSSLKKLTETLWKEKGNDNLYLSYAMLLRLNDQVEKVVFQKLSLELAKLAITKPSHRDDFRQDADSAVPAELKLETENLLQRISSNIATIKNKTDQTEMWKLAWANYEHSELARLAEQKTKELGHELPREDLINQPFIQRLTTLVYEPNVNFDLDALCTI